MITPAERRVLEELVRDGADNYVIAERLGCKQATVKFHMYGLFQKANVSNRTALALWWIRKGRYEHHPVPDLRIAAQCLDAPSLSLSPLS
jgi:DNA-binding NarL/FixJ family response regulator